MALARRCSASRRRDTWPFDAAELTPGLGAQLLLGRQTSRVSNRRLKGKSFGGVRLAIPSYTRDGPQGDCFDPQPTAGPNVRGE